MAGQHRGAWVSAYMDEDALKELRTMERRFPKEFSRALNAVGFYMRKRLRDAIKAGGPDGKKWEPLSYIQATDWLEVSRRHRGLVGPLPRKRFAMQRLMPAMRYKKVHARHGVIIGATRSVSEDYLKAVQDGVRQYAHFRNVYETIAGCTVSCHCGPGTMGILFVRKA